jgi:hypothetical protein
MNRTYARLSRVYETATRPYEPATTSELHSWSELVATASPSESKTVPPGLTRAQYTSGWFERVSLQQTTKFLPSNATRVPCCVIGAVEIGIGLASSTVPSAATRLPKMSPLE